jgi:S-adenosylmethionine:tRNA ribosyltransferase-isomerase
MHLSDFDYELPEELIAQQPLERRDASRMLVLNREARSWTDSKFQNLPEYLRPNDVVVVNNTRVFPARLIGRRDPSGARVEVLLIRECEPSIWEALVRPGHRFKPGARLRFGDSSLRAEVLDSVATGVKRLRFESDEPLEALIDKLGETPLPPYIRRISGASVEDRDRYQTVFARMRGAIAAPTAGLHFTPEVTEAILARGARVAEITLHVGYGTFEPVRVENIADHRVASEWFQISEETARVINDSRAQDGRVIAVGTTTTRALESSVNAEGILEAGERESKVTIIPGYKFRVTDALLTNFHLPRSSLLLLVCAFAGRGLTLDAYRHAVAERFRFFSYGDCMLVI